MKLSVKLKFHTEYCHEYDHVQIVFREDILRQIIGDCRKMFVSEDAEDCFGTWLLVDACDATEYIDSEISINEMMND